MVESMPTCAQHFILGLRTEIPDSVPSRASGVLVFPQTLQQFRLHFVEQVIGGCTAVAR
jgi:hypothetical protein